MTDLGRPMWPGHLNEEAVMAKDEPVMPPAAKKAQAEQDKKKKVIRRDRPVKIGTPRWVVPVMLGSFIIGLIWIVAYYIAPDAPVLKDLGWWNVLIGFGFLSIGFVTATRWR